MPKARPKPVRKLDPTRTGQLRQAFARALRRKFRRLAGDVYKFVVTDDHLGLAAPKLGFNAFCPTGPGGGIDPTCSPGGASAAGSEHGGSLEHVPAGIPPALVSKVKEVAAALKAKLVDRYGAKTAAAIVVAAQATSWGAFGAGALMGVPVWVPSAVAALPYIGLAELRHQLQERKLTKNEADTAYLTLDDDELEAVVAELIRELQKEFEEYQDPVRNAFCPTGPGGGQDNSCSPTGGPAHSSDVAGAADVYVQLGNQINSRLRLWEKLPAFLREEMAKIDGAMSPSPVAKTLHRGTDGDELKGKGPGDTFTDKGYTSTSTSQSAIEPFVSEGGYRITVSVPAGAKALEVGGAHDEVILARGTKFKIDDIDHQARTAKLSVIGPGLTPVPKPAGPSKKDQEQIDYLRSRIKSSRSMGERVQLRRQLKELTDNLAANTEPGRFAFASDPDKLAEFQKWLRQRFASELLGKSNEELWRRYVEEGFRRGAGRAFDDARKDEKSTGLRSDEYWQGSREEFLRSSFGRPETVEKTQLLASRSFADLKNVTEDAATKMGRVLTDGLVAGQNPRDIARDLDDELDLGRNRAELIARTEIIRAHAEGQLDAFDRLGVTDLGVEVEWSTAGDERVCPECEDMEGKLFSVEDAHGMIPLHPNCRCAFVPYVDVEGLTKGHSDDSEES